MTNLWKRTRHCSICYIWLHTESLLYQTLIYWCSGICTLCNYLCLIWYLIVQPPTLWVLSGQEINQKPSQSDTGLSLCAEQAQLIGPSHEICEDWQHCQFGKYDCNSIPDWLYMYGNSCGKTVQIWSDMTLCFSLEIPSTIQEFTTPWAWTRYTRGVGQFHVKG